MPFPYITESAQASILSATSNVLAQAISAYREDRAFSIETTPILQFVGYAILNTPVNCAWQVWLEEQFPGSTSTTPDLATFPETSAASTAYSESADEKKAPNGTVDTKATARLTIGDKTITKKSTFNLRNTLIKFALDQTVGAAFNTMLFIAGIGMLKGQSWDEVLNSIQNDSMTIYWAGVKLWPAVSIISFTLIPVERRVVFGSIVGVLWGIFLSLQAAK